MHCMLGARSRTVRICLWTLAVVVALGVRSASAARIKDIATVRGVTYNQLVGVGLVIGLNRTGDRTTSVGFTRQMVVNMLRRQGLTPEQVRSLDTDNVAAVMVTAEIPPFTRQGTKFDVQASSIGDARSLYGGTLLKTALLDDRGGEVATAQGSLATGGFQAASFGSSYQRNTVTVGRVPNGGILVADVGAGAITAPDPDATDPANAAETIMLGLHNADFTTASRVADAVNASLGAGAAVAVDAASVRVIVPTTPASGIVAFIAGVESLEVVPDQRARVVVNERTGSVVMGRDVRISQVAVSVASITVDVLTRATVSQPSPYSQGETMVVPESDIIVTEPGADMYEGGPVQVIPESTSLNQLVQALNAIGVSPRDLISILQAIKQQGALQAELEIM